MIKFIESVETKTVQLEVFECDCGFHIGLDFTYLDQVENISMPCPSCGALIETKEYGD